MDSVVSLIVLVLAAIVVMPIVAIVIATSRARELRAEMAGLMDRIRGLEATLRNLSEAPRFPAEPPTREATQGSHAMPAPAAPTFRPEEVEPLPPPAQVLPPPP